MHPWQQKKVDELEADLKRVKELPPGPEEPTLLSQIDWAPVIKLAEAGKAEDSAREFDDDDLKQYIYEAVMTACYGPGYFPWVRSLN